MSEQFFIRHGGREQGPFSVEKLHEMFRRGRFSRAYQVSTDRQSWQRAGELPELFPAAASTGRGPRSAPVGPNVDAEPEPEPMLSDDEQQPESDAYALESNVPSGASSTGPLWHYTSNDIEQTPVPLAQLQDRVREGAVRRDDQVWSAGMPDWMIASQVPELQEHFPTVGGANVSVAGLPGTDQSALAVSPGHTQTAPMTVASLVLGLLGVNAQILFASLLFKTLTFDLWYRVSMLFVLASILAVVFGHIGLGQIKESKGRLGGRGLAVAGLIFGYAVIAISIVVGIVLFVLEATDGR